ncbi:MAG: Plug domain-containing protein [Rhizomicrobium sp.]
MQAEAADAPSAATNSSEVETVVVIGAGETRSVSTLLPENLDVLPPGTSVQKALNFLPGVMAQSIDALGLNEQSLSLQVRGFSTTHLGYTLDGMPLGDGAYNNYKRPHDQPRADLRESRPRRSRDRHCRPQRRLDQQPRRRGDLCVQRPARGVGARGKPERRQRKRRAYLRALRYRRVRGFFCLYLRAVQPTGPVREPRCL